MSDESKPASPLNNSEPAKKTSDVLCVVCQTVNPGDALTCCKCGALLTTDGATRRFVVGESQPEKRNRFTGTAIGGEQGKITLITDAGELTFAILDEVTIGRIHPTKDEVPDIDLTPYGAADKGVSRLHIKIIRKDMMFYVTDLGSTNGTDLNGQRLLPHSVRMLRSGDDLKLGQFRVKLRF